MDALIAPVLGAICMCFFWYSKTGNMRDTAWVFPVSLVVNIGFIAAWDWLKDRKKK
jgi:hypothetical protein